jgi:hypothetical protein
LWQLYASRPLIEATVLELCRGVRNVTFLERTEVTALRAAGETQRYCTGVDVLMRDDGKTRTLEADLVVDASGAHSRAAEWLRQLDLELPEDEVIDGYSGYSSRWFALGNQHAWPPEWWWKVLFLRLATPERPYFIAFFPIENQRWLLSYIGVNKAYPPTREDEFTAALTRLASPVVHEMVRRMAPISPVYPSRATRNRWRHGGGGHRRQVRRDRTRPAITSAVWRARAAAVPRGSSRTAGFSASLTRACQAGSSPRRRTSRGRRGCLRQPTTCGFRPPWATGPSRCGCSTGIGPSWSPAPTGRWARVSAR